MIFTCFVFFDMFNALSCRSQVSKFFLWSTVLSGLFEAHDPLYHTRDQLIALTRSVNKNGVQCGLDVTESCVQR